MREKNFYYLLWMNIILDIRILYDCVKNLKWKLRYGQIYGILEVLNITMTPFIKCRIEHKCWICVELALLSGNKVHDIICCFDIPSNYDSNNTLAWFSMKTIIQLSIVEISVGTQFSWFDENGFRHNSLRTNLLNFQQPN